MKLNPYPSYKSTDISWLGEIPCDWDVKPLRALLIQRNEKNAPIKTTQILSLSIARGVTLYSHEGRGGNRAKNDLTAYKIAHPNDIVLNSMNVIVGAVGLSKYHGAISPVYYALYSRFDNAYINYYNKIFSNPVFQRYLTIYGKGILIKKGEGDKLNTIRMKISQDDLKVISLPFPSKNEQIQIAKFLDWKISKINKFIINKRKLIALLKEQKQNIINQAVTRGIDPNVKLKPSGVEWIGDIPEHWEFRRLRTIAIVKTSGIDKKSYEGETSVYLCNYVDVYKNDRITDDIDFMLATATQDEILLFELKSDDVVITKDSETWKDIAVPAFVPNELPGVVCGYHLALIRPFCGVVAGEFLCRAFSADPIANQFRFSANGVTRFGLTQGSIKEAFFPIPPRDEQLAIIKQLNAKSKEIDEAVLRAEREIELIREYQTRLISDVVTGKVDVRGIVLPELLEEEFVELKENDVDSDEIFVTDFELESE